MARRFLFAFLCFVLLVGAISALSVDDIDIVSDKFFEICSKAESDNVANEWYYHQKTKDKQPINITMEMRLFRFIEISDLEQRLSLFVDIYTEWTLPPCNISQLCGNLSEAITEDDDDNGGDSDDGTVTVSPKDPVLPSSCPNGDEYGNLTVLLSKTCDTCWFPGFRHHTAVSKAWQITNEMNDDLVLRPFLNTVYWRFSGRLDNACTSFSFAKFPFDTLNCSIVLDSEEPAHYVNVQIRSFSIDQSVRDDFIGDTDVWELVEPNPLTSSIEIKPQSDNRKYHRLYFTMLFKRRYNYYIGSIFLPIFALFLLQVATLIMPPRYPDRPGFSMTVVLAFSVILAMVFGGIPQTSENVYLINFVVVKLACGLVVTIYSLIACAVAKKDPQPLRKCFLCFKGMSLLRAIDCVAAFVIISGVIVADIILLSLMTS